MEIPPITFAGLRYMLAFFFFVPFFLKKKYIVELKQLTKIQWEKLILLGLVFYTFTQGCMFLGLYFLPSVTVSLMLNFTPIIVAIMGIWLLSEKPSLLQWSGTALFLVGIITYFFPTNLAESRGIGLAIMGIGIVANALSAIIGRSINRSRKISPMVVTFVSMGVGAFLLVIIGFAKDGIPVLNLQNWLFLLWLAGINTAFAFTLWNVTLRTLTAMESSIINGTMLIQIAILAWVFLGESITLLEGTGMMIAAVGAVLVQVKRKIKN